MGGGWLSLGLRVKPSLHVLYLLYSEQKVQHYHQYSVQSSSFWTEGTSSSVKCCYNLPQWRGIWMQRSNIPSTFPWDFGNQELSLVWNKFNNTPSWKGPRPALLPVRVRPGCQASNHFLGLLPCFSRCKPIHPSQSAAISILQHRAPDMPCTAGIKVTAAYVGVPASDAYMMMGWNAMTAKHKELHPEVQQAHLARIGLWHSTLCHQYHLLPCCRSWSCGSPGFLLLPSPKPIQIRETASHLQGFVKTKL